jgi:hypothetical protein
MKKLYLAVAVVLGLLGGALLWGGVYASNFVHDNLAEQKITFASADALAAQGREDLVKYADETVDNGQEAKAFASYIQGHIAKIASGQTYSEVSAQYQALTPEQKATAEGKKLEGQRMSIFMGETLRGTLLNAYGWGFVAKIALLAGAGLVLVAGVLAAVVLISSVSPIPKKGKKVAKKRK